ncbi:hypothetical protein [Thermoflavimicrobium daqui]|uniref:Uncharacterized protein n=1 Tax=Thermoflavimicrobium daqui TaxID=2137476 RepID=A0A364K1D0_9BACL|nr:hypothetical protein [Thermoflavimicrobium daqui]RAL21484.1 hypothetical protein DL897_16135 [Thermoflavimicrobium daqui]
MGESLILSMLKRSMEEKCMVSVFTDRSQPDSCSVGFIHSLSSKQFAMKHVTPDGYNDGYILRRIEDIFRVDIAGEYERRLELIYTLQKQPYKDLMNAGVAFESDLFRACLVRAQDENLVVTICIDENDSQLNMVGFVKEMGSHEVTITRITSNGLDDGESTFYIEDIVKINCDTAEEKTCKLLFDHRKTLERK